MHVLRLCSVFEALPGTPLAGGFDSVGGMQNQTACLTRELDARGVRQTVVTSRLSGPPGRTAFGRSASIVRVGLPLRKLRQLWAGAALPTVLGRDESVDVVHAHQGEDVATLLLALLAVARHRCPLVVTIHCSVRHTVRGTAPRTLWLRTVGAAVETAALRRADAVVVLSQQGVRDARRSGVTADRTHVVPSGFEPAKFAGAVAADPFPQVGRPRIGFVGRLASSKRPDLLLRAFDLVQQPAYLVIVGDGPERRRVHAMAAASGRRERVHLTGFVAHERVPAVLASLDLLVLPSDYEELGSVLLEAMATGLPVVATRAGGIPEVVRDGVTGLLVPPGDMQALAGAIDSVLADPQHARKLGGAARHHAEAYAWPHLAQRVATVYEQAIKSRQQRAGRPRPPAPHRHRRRRRTTGRPHTAERSAQPRTPGIGSETTPAPGDGDA